jgi:hypothetical protein
MKTRKAMAVAAVWMAIAAANIALATTAQADPNYQLFQSPSGNIRCETTVSYKGTPYADCTVQDSTYAVPPGQCQLPGSVIPQFVLTQGETLNLSCVSGSVKPPWPTLDYGQTRSTGAITCDSEPSGVTCTDSSTGHFFRVSEESYQLG